MNIISNKNGIFCHNNTTAFNFRPLNLIVVKNTNSPLAICFQITIGVKNKQLVFFIVPKIYKKYKLLFTKRGNANRLRA